MDSLTFAYTLLEDPTPDPATVEECALAVARQWQEMSQEDRAALTEGIRQWNLAHLDAVAVRRAWGALWRQVHADQLERSAPVRVEDLFCAQGERLMRGDRAVVGGRIVVVRP